MDVNIVYECIGFGASRAVASHGFATTRSRVPARFIMETAKDPVAYCIEAYTNGRPEQAEAIDGEGRALILARLRHEAGLNRH